LQQFLTRTFLGRAIRSLTQDRQAAELVGVPVERVSMVAFGLGIALAALAGSLLALIFPLTPEFGRAFMLKAFGIIVLGGMTSFVGVAVGAFILSVVESLSTFYFRAALQDMISFLLLVVILVIAPNGILVPI